MKAIDGIESNDVQSVYSGPVGDLWELIMGEQIHIGGFSSSMALADMAIIKEGMKGIDLCCCNGGGMRFLVRFRNVSSMIGIDFTETVVDRGIERCKSEGFGEKIRFILADATKSGLPDGEADFIWGEDAWCYVKDKDKLISEASRLVKSEGIIAFTDWIEGPAGLSEKEAERFLKFMKFPNIQDLQGYQRLLEQNDCEVLTSELSGLFAPYVDLYLNMLNKQLTYDALKIIDFDLELMQNMGEEMTFMQGLAHEKKIAQGRFIAKKV